MKRSSVKALVVGMVLALVGCATTLTGRKQLLILPESMMSEMGVQAFAQMKESVPIDKAPAMNEYVGCVAQAIVAEVPKRVGPKEWEVVVFEDETANAFALPGGKIGVHTGILQVAQTPDQLAAIIGHEVSHVLLRHGNERASQTLLAQGVSTVAAVSVSELGEGSQQAILGGLAIGAQLGVLLPFSRKHESEADVFGQEFMAKAGFDPRESVKLWENMAEMGGGGAPPEFMSTHPAHDTRIRRLEKGMPKAMELFQEARAEGKHPQCKRPPTTEAPSDATPASK